MATASTTSLWLVAVFVCIGSVLSAESPSEISHIDLPVGSSHHQAQKRSAAAILEPVDSAYPGVEVDQIYPGTASFLEGPYVEDDSSADETAMDKRTLFRFGKRGSIFRFGKRAGGSLFRFGKRGGSLLRFGKRGGSLFRFGKRSGVQGWDDNNEAAKRGTMFRFGKRAIAAADSDSLLDTLESYYGGVPTYALTDDVDSKRNVNSFHWGSPEK